MELGRGDGGSNYNAWALSTFTAVSRPVGFKPLELRGVASRAATRMGEGC